MAYINVAEWSPEQVTDWIKGLDDSMYKYVFSFHNKKVGGHQLLNIRPYELEQLGMTSIGHQEIVLEAVENLRNFHFNLDKENLQFMALHVATAARCLHRQLALKTGETMIETQVLNDITRTIATIKPLICWLDRSPFLGQFQFTEICRKMLRLGLEMATIAQRERFVERPVEQIRTTAETLERLANYIIQDITDPMLLQPASLNLVTLKKRESELGFNIETSYHGVHRVTDIKHNSPAHNSGKIEDGDEIVQINYQTVVGWQYKTVLLQLRESLPDVLLTLKKRPKHTKIYGQIYMQPYRLPSKKRNIGTRWGENVPSPRPGFLDVPETTFKMPPLTLNVENEKNDDADTDSICSDILTPTDAKVLEKESRLYYPKPRAMLQRRNTICGDEVMRHKSLGVVSHWIESKSGIGGDPSSPSLRDKSVSFGFGLEINPRPTTCIGISGGSNSKYVGEFNDKKLRKIVEQSSDKSLSSKPGVCKVVRFDATMKAEDYPLDEKYTCNVQNTILETFEPIPFADEEEDGTESLRFAQEKSDVSAEGPNKENISNKNSLVETINIPVVVRRGRLDKSHSTPAYDNSGEDSDTPPAIEPRKEFLIVTPPVPPPRPKKLHEMSPRTVPIPPPKPPGLMQGITTSPVPLKTQQIQHESSQPKMTTNSPNVSPNNAGDASAIHNSTFSLAATSDAPTEGSEIHTPTKTRTLTLKKKHSLISKRRNVNLKILGTGDIQGYLYRRTKDKRGVTFWDRLYFVMLDTILYGFRSKEASKANCVIFLPGFTVSLAKEVHSKPFAFKVYHSAKTFYFAAESQDALNQWVEFIRVSTLAQHTNTLNGSEAEIDSSTLFSENDSSSEESESVVTKNLCTPSPQANREMSVSSASVQTKTPNSTPISTKSDRRYLGSLRKLTKGSLQFKSSSANEKKMSNDIPVPTDQFRSYRKVPGGNSGIQIGTNAPVYQDSSLHPINVSSTNVHCGEQQQSTLLPQQQPQQRQPVQQPQQQHTVALTSTNEKTVHSHPRQTSSGCETSMVSLEPPSSPAPVPLIYKDATSMTSNQSKGVTSPSKSVKKIPYNFIHASNPNLVEFDFQTSRTLDYNLPKINSTNAWDALPTNIQGFVTLKDLMLQKQEEEAQEMYNNRVLLGVEKKEDHKRNVAQRQQNQGNGLPDDGGGGQHCEDQKVSKTQSRSLPKPPDYEISFKPDDEDIQLTRTKEGLKLRDFGYELISGDEPLGAPSTTARQYLQSNRHLTQHTDMHDTMCSSSNWTSAMKSKSFLLSSNKLKKNSTSSSCSSADFNIGPGGERRLGSFKKKGKLETFKTSSERIFQFGKHGSSSSAAGTTMTLPLNKKTSNLSSDACGNSGIKKSQTYNNELKEKAGKYDAQRKNSAPMPIFGKLSFSSSSSAPNANNKNDSKKDKKNCNSPLFHRTLFGHQNNANSQQEHISGSNAYTGRDYDQEIFSQVVFPKKNSNRKQSIVTPVANNDIITAPDVTAPPPPSKASNANDIPQSVSGVSTTEYPNMECPPVFEPDIYSLDPNASLLLRRNNNNNHNSRENENN
ncbi:uncharacterized protein LOC133337017 [Musca vetustissima]|uniref:uncharacterized protein LOC133337017 n=1 Tax=Musca vetustissima TaxID=27455 RepID=UPI002AB73E23|nr:uncharacterized protein LOC133337017 [Musca vetustissima]